MIVECPHCLRRVLPKSDGACPSCGKDPKDTAGTDPTRAVLMVHPRMRFPTSCFHCTMPATKTVAAAFSNESGSKDLARVLMTKLIPFGLGHVFAGFHRVQNDLSMQVKLPICKGCRSRKITPKVQSFDLQSRHAHVVVHKDFAQAALSLG